MIPCDMPPPRPRQPGRAHFNFLAGVVGTTVSARDPVPAEPIRQLRAGGLSLTRIAHETGSTVAEVRRIVGQIDQPARRQRQEELARRRAAEPLTWGEKAAQWAAETGWSAVTLWRVRKRIRG